MSTTQSSFIDRLPSLVSPRRSTATTPRSARSSVGGGRGGTGAGGVGSTGTGSGSAAIDSLALRYFNDENPLFDQLHRTNDPSIAPSTTSSPSLTVLANTARTPRRWHRTDHRTNISATPVPVPQPQPPSFAAKEGVNGMMDYLSPRRASAAAASPRRAAPLLSPRSPRAASVTSTASPLPLQRSGASSKMDMVNNNNNDWDNQWWVRLHQQGPSSDAFITATNSNGGDHKTPSPPPPASSSRHSNNGWSSRSGLRSQRLVARYHVTQPAQVAFARTSPPTLSFKGFDNLHTQPSSTVPTTSTTITMTPSSIIGNNGIESSNGADLYSPAGSPSQGGSGRERSVRWRRQTVVATATGASTPSLTNPTSEQNEFKQSNDKIEEKEESIIRDQRVALKQASRTMNSKRRQRGMKKHAKIAQYDDVSELHGFLSQKNIRALLKQTNYNRREL
jgi:hypothetical protein